MLRVEEKGRLMLYAGHAQPKEMIDGAHPVAVSFRQVVVDRDNMSSFASEGIEVNREGSHQSLSLASLHLGYLALMENDAAH